ncbi:hypothetical protein BDF19DRAFT_325958 [Syncephalis fuscata]|nr:hypothetical protein BDF19DRAFT_325958 [Syncephalis fuscata]
MLNNRRYDRLTKSSPLFKTRTPKINEKKIRSADFFGNIAIRRSGDDLFYSLTHPVILNLLIANKIFSLLLCLFSSIEICSKSLSLFIVLYCRIKIAWVILY